MRLFTVLVIFCLGSTILLGQDAYHNTLLGNLETEYGLSGGTFLLPSNENSALQASFNWGSQRSNVDVDGQDYSRAARVSVGQPGNNPWDAGYFFNPATPLQQGDVVLWVFNLRSEDTPGLVSVVAERTSDFQKEVFSNLEVGTEWQQFFVAFRVGFGPHDVGGIQMGFHLGHRAQNLQIGGMTAINYGATVELEDLPNFFDPANYGGNEDDAPWRSVAADRIDQFRKADLTLRAVNSSGIPVNDVVVDVEMQSHEFAFGTAIKACRLAGNNCNNMVFQDKLTDLDGEGHGFNWVVFENDLKWPAWEQEWVATNQEVIDAIGWLRERDINIRGHVLLWPGNSNLPDDVSNNRMDTTYVLNRIREHINTMATLPGLAGQIAEWDVVNETVTNTSLEEAFRGQGDYVTGRELFTQTFTEADAAMPDVKLYYNDFVTLSLDNQAGSPAYEAMYRNVQEMVEAGAPIDGIGFQGHIGSFPNGIPDVLATLDNFYEDFGLEARITEFDLPGNVPEAVSSKYLGDFLTATFSHPSMSGFLTWSFWDTDTYMNPGANLYDENWQPKANHAVFVDKVFNEWWTDETVATDADGNGTVRAFKGQYVISYGCGEERITQTVDLTRDTILTLTCDDFITSAPDLIDEGQSVVISPNPTDGNFTIDHPFSTRAKLTCLNVLGQTLWTQQLTQQQQQLVPNLPAGTYMIRIEDGVRVATKQLIIK